MARMTVGGDGGNSVTMSPRQDRLWTLLRDVEKFPLNDWSTDSQIKPLIPRFEALLEKLGTAPLGIVPSEVSADHRLALIRDVESLMRRTPDARSKGK